MHYFDIVDVQAQARVFWAMRGYWELDVYICKTGHVVFLEELQ